MTVVLLAPHWAANKRIQHAANNNSPMRQGDPDSAAVTLLQSALMKSGFTMSKGADGSFGPQTAGAVRAAETRFGFAVDQGVAGREVIGALDLALRGWSPPAGDHWGGLLAMTVVPLAQSKVTKALAALTEISTMLKVAKFDFVTANGVTMAALQTHFKLVPPGGTKHSFEDFITTATINPLLSNFRGLQRTLANAGLRRHSICTLGLDVAAEAAFGGQILFGPPYSDFKHDPVAITNIDKTGPNSLVAMMIHEATHVIDGQSGTDTTHISEFDVAYEMQAAGRARHNPSAYATFAAHIFENGDRPRSLRYGLGAGRPL